MKRMLIVIAFAIAFAFSGAGATTHGSNCSGGPFPRSSTPVCA